MICGSPRCGPWVQCNAMNVVPTNEPTTMAMSAQNRTSTPSFWNFGSRPDSSGAMYRPVASQAVAIQKIPTWVWMVRLTTYGSTSASGMPKKPWPSTE